MPAPAPKKKFQHYDPDQIMLIPQDLHEWLPKDHFCYFISDVVDDLDISCASYDELRGFPPYEPRMMVKVIIYAYSIGMTSS